MVGATQPASTASYQPSDTPSEDTVITPAYFEISEDEYLNHPVTGVTWYGANSYSNHFGWRLPTVDEWKYIASGNSTSWKYPYLNKQANHSWVDTSQTNCNYNRQQENTTTDVTKFESFISYFGAVDIIGNVYELTNSQHEQSGLNIIVGGSYNSECKFIDNKTVTRIEKTKLKFFFKEKNKKTRDATFIMK